MANFVDFIGEGRGSQALAKALVETERRVESLTAEVDGLRRSRDKVFRTPPVEWIHDRLSNLKRSWSSARRRRHKRSARSWVQAGWNLSPGYRPPLLSSHHSARRARLNRIAPRRCGGRFEFIAKVETAGS